MGAAAGICSGRPARANAGRLRVALAAPGRQSDPFWQMSASIMRAAARDLDIDLIIEWGERDRSQIIAVGEALVDQRPDYLLVVNEYRTAVPIIQAAQRRNIPCLLTFSGLMEEDVAMLNNSGGIQYLLGSLMPDNLGAGRFMAHALIETARRAGLSRDNKVPLIAIGATRSTSSALDRLNGLYQVLRADPAAQLLDVVSVNWSRDEAYQRTLALLRRQPQVNAVWAANDDMALGAMQAASDLGRRPGGDIFFVGLNWQREALDAVADGRMRLSMGGHFLVGAWALALLRDHFDSGRGPVTGVREVVKLAVMDRERVAFYRQYFDGGGWEKLDYRRFRQGNAAPGFAVEPLLVQLPPAKPLGDFRG
ncbi:substrate-binding domain-containing protein [Niveispirillum sp. SYP-B3756]|nr:substrate-binding domain-containing protein [Niveispirillum sp. SYP-B3756]